MSLVKAWLFFPEVLRIYEKKKLQTKKHGDGDFNSIIADLESGDSGVRHYSNDLIQRVKRVLNYLEEKNTEEKKFVYGSGDSSNGNNFENDVNFGSNSNIVADNRQIDAVQDNGNVYDPDKITGWKDGIDIRVPKSNKKEAGYDMYHLVQRNHNFKYSSNLSPNNLQSLSNGESDQDGRPQSLHAADLNNNHNKEHLKIIERSKADVLPGDFHTTSDAESQTVFVDKKPTLNAEEKPHIVEQTFNKDHFYPTEIHDSRDLQQDLSAGSVIFFMEP